MKIKHICTTCKTPHEDYDMCSKCEHRIVDFIYVYKNDTPEIIKERKEKELWKFCPWCGERL